MSARIVCISNRVSLPRKAAAPGGLAVGVLGALKNSGGLWFGWGGELSDAEPAEPDLQTRDGVTYATLKLRRQEFNRYYNGYANGALWPLFHYMSGKFRFRHDEYEAYESVNGLFAKKLLPLLRPDDLLWVHDYHLIALARHLREMGARNAIGFFLHIPFPHIETLRILPGYENLVRDLARFDIVGFQTAGDLASFRSAISHIHVAKSSGTEEKEPRSEMQLDGHDLHAGVFPIGVDVGAIAADAERACRSEVIKRMIASLVGRKLMIGVDRLDYSKGLVERFATYEQFLETYPDKRAHITYLQIAPVSRKDVPSYVDIRRALEQAAGRTNGRFADADWTPVRYLNRNYPHETLMGFLRIGNVGLVTPLRDGMNLVAKEYVAAQDPEDPGVLILSNFAGAAYELDAALQVNPHDTRAVVQAIDQALMMPLPERQERHASLMKALKHHSIQVWADRFIAQLKAVRR